MAEAHACISSGRPPTQARVPRRSHRQLQTTSEDVLMAEKRITIRATRFDPEKDKAPRLQSYDIPFSDESMVVLDALNHIKDFMHKLKSIKPWIIRQQEYPLGSGEHRQTMEQIDEFRQFSECINCMLCYAACPVYGLNNEFLGPAAIALSRRYNLDSRDQGIKERLPVIANSEGIWECSFVGECSVVCPKGVDPAKAIQQTKLDTTMRFVLPYGNREE